MVPPGRSYKVLVIDDSRTIRRLISAIVEETEGLSLAGEAESAEDAMALLQRPGFSCDVISLDIELPGMNGIEFLKKLMARKPVPVLVVSGHTDASADLTMTALENGAIDCIQKPDGRPSEIDRFLSETASGLLRAASSTRARPAPQMGVTSLQSTIATIAAGGGAKAALAAGGHFDSESLICIGASTGGVPAVCKVVQGLAQVSCPIVVVQHMPPNFTGRLATRLAQTTGLPAVEAKDGQRLTPRAVWVAPGGSHLRIQHRAGGYVAQLSDEDPVSGHRPSIDVLFRSAAAEAGASATGVLLTGMGRDGADGLLAMRKAGSNTFAQDEASCVVYGMPKAAVQLGAAGQVLHLDRIADAVLHAGTPGPARRSLARHG